MIFSLKIKNFLSFKDEVIFSFEATNDKHLEGSHIVEIKPGVRIGKLGVVYGANASGKSNLIKAFDFLKDFWFHTPDSKDEETDVIPFLLDRNSRDIPTEFELTFFADKTKYIYEAHLTKNSVIKETLSYYPGSQPANIFTRQLQKGLSDIKFNNALKISSIAQEEIKVKCITNMSIIAAYNKVNVQLPVMDAAIDWMKNHYLQAVKPGLQYLEKYTESIILKNNDVKNFVLNFLYKADYNICEISTKLEKRDIPDELIDFLMNEDISDEEKLRIKKEKTIEMPSTKFTHKVVNEVGDEKQFDLPGELQSRGTLRSMGLSGVLKTMLEKSAFVAIDEIEASLHPKLVEFYLESFLKQSDRSQLLITTHYDGLLEADDLLRNDSIWFTGKKTCGSTELYSLSDFKGVNRLSSLQKAYKYGKFGAIPNI